MTSRSILTTLCAAGVFAAASLAIVPHGAKAADDAGKKPYVVKSGNKVDMTTYKGFLYYGDECMRCHGPDGMGSSYAPNLTESLKVLSEDQFQNTVVNGRKNVNSSNDKVMPAFGTNSDVIENLPSIYAYLKARSDGALGRGHPEHLE